MTEYKETEAKKEDKNSIKDLPLADRLFRKDGIIATLTLNPSLDVFVSLEKRLILSETNRSTFSVTKAGGKGINVSRELTRLGVPNLAYFPVGGGEGEVLKRLIKQDGISFRTSPVAAETRTNYKFSDPLGVTTEVNGRGGPVSTYEIDELLSLLSADFPIISTLVISGSVPFGVDGIIYSTIINRAKSFGIGTVLDTSSKALELGLSSSPDLIKPNRRELSELLRCPILTMADTIDGCTYIYEKYGTSVLCTLGADGAVFVDEDGVTECKAPKVSPTVTTGAGDCYLAGFLHCLCSYARNYLRTGKDKGFAANDIISFAMQSGAVSSAHALGGAQV